MWKKYFTDLPTGVYLKKKDKYEVHLTINRIVTYIALFSNLEAALFTHENHHLFEKYNVERNGKCQGDKFWKVKDKYYSADKIKSAFSYGKKINKK